LHELLTYLKENGRITDASILSLEYVTPENRAEALSLGFVIPEHAVLGGPHVQVGVLLDLIQTKYGRIESLEFLSSEYLDPQYREYYRVKKYGGTRKRSRRRRYKSRRS